MRVKWLSRCLAVSAILLSGCGEENNLFDSLADNSPGGKAKLEEAQQALSDGDCQTAINNFLAIHNSDPLNVPIRIDLAAAYMCRAGFNLTNLLRVAVNFGSNPLLADQLFKDILIETVEFIGTTWLDDTANAKSMLAIDSNDPLLVAFNNDANAAFDLAIVSLAEVSLLISDILNLTNGVVGCDPLIPTPVGLDTVPDCKITQGTVNSVVNSLANSSSLLSIFLGASTDVANTASNVLVDLVGGNCLAGAAPGDLCYDAVTTGDLGNYLLSQGIITPANADQICVVEYDYDAVGNKYVVDITVSCP